MTHLTINTNQQSHSIDLLPPPDDQCLTVVEGLDLNGIDQLGELENRQGKCWSYIYKRSVAIETLEVDAQRIADAVAETGVEVAQNKILPNQETLSPQPKQTQRRWGSLAVLLARLQ